MVTEWIDTEVFLDPAETFKIEYAIIPRQHKQNTKSSIQDKQMFSTM